MKRIFFSLAFFLGCLAQTSWSQAILYRNDRLTTREDITPLRAEWAPFYHGVASGDPLSDQVVIWTRVTPDDLNANTIEVSWRVATDPGLNEVIITGNTTTEASIDYTVKVDVTGLSPGTTYYYGFSALGRHSLTGRTKTTPTEDQVDHLKFGVVTCSNYQAGYFNAYQRLAERNDLDAIIHLGDYIYEYGNGESGGLVNERPVEPVAEILSLEDYRTRYSTYRLDTSLIRAHQQHPFITVWDDHEFANNAYADGAQNHDPTTEGEWDQRLANARQAYFEWMPIRDAQPQQIYRRISYGNLMDLILLDTRTEGREKQIYDPFDPALQDTSRTLLGLTQKTWLLDQLAASGARWKIIGQQVIFAPFEAGWSAALDQDPATTYVLAQGLVQDVWNGYPAERQQIIDFIGDNSIDNVVILTGDFHTSFAFDINEQPVNISFQDLPDLGLTPFYSPSDTYDPITGEGSEMVEFVTPSITAANFDENFGPIISFFLEQLLNRPIQLPGNVNIGNPNPHLKYADLSKHGYFILDVKPDSVQANWYHGEILQVTDQEVFNAGWYTRNGANRLQQALAPSAPKVFQETPAPAEPPMTGPTAARPTGSGEAPFTLLGVYPNPFAETNTIHYSVNRPASIQIDLYNLSGEKIRQVLDRRVPPGLYSLEFHGNELPEGTYIYQIRVNGQQQTVKIIRMRQP